MELALSLGDTSKSFAFLDKAPATMATKDKDLDFCMGLGSGFGVRSSKGGGKDVVSSSKASTTSDPPSSSSSLLQLDLLPFSPVLRSNHKPSTSQFRLPWLAETLRSEPETSGGSGKGLDVNRRPAGAVGEDQEEEEAEDGAAQSSPNSALSAFQVEFGLRSGGVRTDSNNNSKRTMDYSAMEMGENERGSDDDDNGLTRKKLRLSKEQSAFLEDSFKEHNTLNPKQKLALAKQLNLRPRQVEVWFQNRRARTKLKQTEIDCEYLKRCCETLTEENRRLQKELQELRALKTSQPFYMQLPATTLTMCPSCERVATTSTSTSSSSAAVAAGVPTPLVKPKPRTYPFPHPTQQQQLHIPQAQSQAQAQVQAHQAAS